MMHLLNLSSDDMEALVEHREKEGVTWQEMHPEEHLGGDQDIHHIRL